MKNTFRKRAQQIKKISEEVIEKITLRVIKENEDYAIELNQQQLHAGKDRIGIPLPMYTPAYAKKKGRKLPDLYLTGQFWRDFTLNADKFPVEITSTDKKTAILIARYGANIFNLSEVNTRKFAKYVKPKIQSEIAKLLRVLQRTT